MPFATLKSNVFKAFAAPVHIVKRYLYDMNPAATDETACEFVSSMGIAKGCQTSMGLGGSVAPAIDPELFWEFPAGVVVYVYTQSIPDFVQHYLPRMRYQFVFVSGADDLSVSYATIPDEVEALLGHPLVTHWFAQNLEVTHSKLTAMPIGMDYHVLAGNHRRPWRPFQSPLRQERELLRVRAAAPAVAQRSCTAYSNWHFFLQRGDRQECFDKVDHSSTFFEPTFVSRRESWTNNASHLFTISPLGNGLDCHRTWEALLLGTIPIVRTSPLDSLYDGLPVCIVQDWAEVDFPFLQRQRERFLAQTFDYAKVYTKYWSALIRGHATFPVVRSIQEFAYG